MLQLRTNQHGFSAIEIAIFVIVLGLLGSGGYVAYNNIQDNKIPANTAASKSTTETTANAEDNNDADTTSSAWYKYTSPKKLYTIRLADGLTVQKADPSSKYYSLITEELTVKPGTPATVTPQNGGHDGAFYGFILNYLADAGEAHLQGDPQIGFKTNGGLAVEKYYYVQTTEPDGLGMAKGDVLYYYLVHKDSKAVEISYTAKPGQDTRVNLIEQMVRSVTIK